MKRTVFGCIVFCTFPIKCVIWDLKTEHYQLMLRKQFIIHACNSHEIIKKWNFKHFWWHLNFLKDYDDLPPPPRRPQLVGTQSRSAAIYPKLCIEAKIRFTYHIYIYTSIYKFYKLSLNLGSKKRNNEANNLLVF